MGITGQDNGIAEVIGIQMVEDPVAVGAVAVPCILCKRKAPSLEAESQSNRGRKYHIHWGHKVLVNALHQLI